MCVLEKFLESEDKWSVSEAHREPGGGGGRRVIAGGTADWQGVASAPPAGRAPGTHEGSAQRGYGGGEMGERTPASSTEAG